MAQDSFLTGSGSESNLWIRKYSGRVESARRLPALEYSTCTEATCNVFRLLTLLCLQVSPHLPESINPALCQPHTHTLLCSTSCLGPFWFQGRMVSPDTQRYNLCCRDIYFFRSNCAVDIQHRQATRIACHNTAGWKVSSCVL